MGSSPTKRAIYTQSTQGNKYENALRTIRVTVVHCRAFDMGCPSHTELRHTRYADSYLLGIRMFLVHFQRDSKRRVHIGAKSAVRFHRFGVLS